MKNQDSGTGGHDGAAGVLKSAAAVGHSATLRAMLRLELVRDAVKIGQAARGSPKAATAGAVFSTGGLLSAVRLRSSLCSIAGARQARRNIGRQAPLLSTQQQQCRK